MASNDLPQLNRTNISNDYYETMSEFYKCRSKSNSLLNILYLNAQSCANLETFNEIKNVCDKMIFDIDILLISETWFKSDQLCLYNLDGYFCAHSCRKVKRGGGVSVYIKEPCAITKIEIHESAWNIIDIELHNFKGFGKLNVYGVYRPQKRSDLTNYMHKIEEIIGSTEGQKILVGDINVDLNKSNDRDVLVYGNFMTSLGMTLCNDKITRESSKAILDHVYTNMDSYRKIHTTTAKCNFSDHSFLLTSIETKQNAMSESQVVRKIDYVKLASIVAEKIRDVPFLTDPDEHYNAVCDLLESVSLQATTTKQK